MNEISPASSLLNVASSKNVESKKEGRDSNLINNHLDSITTPSDSGVEYLKKYCTHVSNNTLTWLKAWCPIKKANKTTADNAFSITGHSLLLQADTISAQHHEGGEPFSPPSLKLKGKAGWIMGAGLLAGATAGTLTWHRYATHQSSAKTDLPEGPPGRSTPEADSVGRGYHVEHLGHFEYIPPALQSANLISESYRQRDEQHYSVSASKHDRKSGVIGFLRKKRLLEKNVKKYETKKEVLISAVAEYLYGSDIVNVTQQANKEISIAMHILAEADLYGGRKGERISHTFAQSVIGHWILRQILGVAPEKYIVDEINKSNYPSYFTISSLKYLLNLNNIFKTGLLNQQDIPAERWSNFNTMWCFYLEKEIPIVKWPDKHIDAISLGSHDFSDLYVGTAFLEDGNYLKDFSLNETLQMGKMLWNLAINEGIGLEHIGYFRLPSLVFLASNQQITLDVKDNAFGSQIAAVNRYIEQRKQMLAVEQMLTGKFERYKSAINAWLSKGALADEIIADCPVSELVSLPDIADGIRSPQQRREKKQRSTKQAYMNGIRKPCANAPETLDDEYKKLTKAVADSFEEIDKLLIWSALVATDKNELDFFSAPTAKINRIHFSMRADRPVAAAHSVGTITDFWVKTKNTDLFSVTVNDQERVYALKKDSNSADSGYQLLRVDRNIRNYIDNGLLDCDRFSKNYNVQGNEVIDSDRFIFSISTLNPPITSGPDDDNPLISHFSKLHSDAFYHGLYETGNDKSDLQKTWSLVKHLIPFYDCIEGIANHDATQAIPACMTDMLALLPVAGQAASIGGRFGMGLAKGVHQGGKAWMRGAVADAGSMVLREIRLPKVDEIITLSKGALRVADPGFELLTRGSKALQNRVDTFLRQRAANIPLAEKLAFHHPIENSAMPAKAYITARLPDSDIEVPIEKISENSQHALYILVNPDTGERFGRHYNLLHNGRLKRAETRMLQQHIRHNTMMNSGGGNRMDQQVLPMPANNPQTDLSHLPLLRRFLSPSVYLPPHMQFNRMPYVHQDVQRHLSDDFTYMGVQIKNYITENYHQNEVYYCRFNQNVEEIPMQFRQLKENLQHYKEGVIFAKQCADALSYEFSRTTMKNSAGELQFSPRGNRIEAYLSKVLKLREITDATVVGVIKKEAMKKLQYHTENIKNYLNNEINNIYFVSCDTATHPYIYNPGCPIGFMPKKDNFRRIIIMVDNYHASPILSTQLHLTTLHEASHYSGSFDFQIAPSTSLVGDASEFIETFSDGVMGVNGETIHIDPDFFDAYRREFPHMDITEHQFRALLVRDPVLKANAFMENADFLARMIADLGSRMPHDRDVHLRRRRNAGLTRSAMSILLYRSVIERMKGVTPDANVQG